jgi:hypothetical protein
MEIRVIRLTADASEVADLDLTAVLARSGEMFRGREVKPWQVARVGRDTVEFTLLVPDGEEPGPVEDDLRAALGDGRPVTYRGGPVRALGGPGSLCKCGGIDGDHFSGCPLHRDRR